MKIRCAILGHRWAYVPPRPRRASWRCTRCGAWLWED